MKYIIILADGMADRLIKELGDKTPLMAANTPNIDKLCAMSCTGKLITVPEGMHPGSEVANMGVLGYNVKEVYEGRGVLEAASMGIRLGNTDLAMRCNLICIEDGKIKNHSAGHITTEEATPIIETLNKEFSSDKLQFYPGVSYRHLLVLKEGSKQIECTPPHDVPGTDFHEVFIKSLSEEGRDTANYLNELIVKSQEILENHPVNLKRKDEGKDPANSIWMWSPGYKPKMKTFKELFGIRKGAVISAVDLIQGIGVYAGFKVIKVEGATGLYDTNYEGKAKAAVDALQDSNFVYLHIEAPDEAGHEGDYKLKTKVIEDIDKKVVKYILEETSHMKEPVSIALLPDHPTPCEIRTHVSDPVPFLIYKPNTLPDQVNKFDEFSVNSGYYGLLKGNEFIKSFLI
ncbi:MAG: cofactor-independent phosphoglycerate mutase [Bacteroidota bacterium]|nr:cofactor-independent phosphoglycerate mutase [Bacteroidota bacterium]MDP4274992.1 cofactor-independent phosphoglycerate mutase [Bacteroidota bacterium]